MNRYSQIPGIMALVLVLCGVATGQAPERSRTSPPLSAADQKTAKAFQDSVANYLKIKNTAGPDANLKHSSDVHEIEKRRDALKGVIRKARPDARQGDLFTSAVSELFQRLLSDTLHGADGNNLRQSLRHAEPVASAQPAKLAINGDFPNKNGQPLQSSPGTLLQSLPVLPKGVEYRLVGKTLVLRDAEANLVIDYLPEAISQ